MGYRSCNIRVGSLRSLKTTRIPQLSTISQVNFYQDLQCPINTSQVRGLLISLDLCQRYVVVNASRVTFKLSDDESSLFTHWIRLLGCFCFSFFFLPWCSLKNVSILEWHAPFGFIDSQATINLLLIQAPCLGIVSLVGQTKSWCLFSLFIS